MLANRTHLLTALFAIAVCLGCSRDDVPPVSDKSADIAGMPTVQSPREVFTIADGRRPTLWGASISTMLEKHTAVVVATVESYEDLSRSLEYVADDAIFDEIEEPAPDAESDPGYIPTLIRFTLRVESVVAGELSSPEMAIQVLQVGGYVSDTAYQAEGDPLIREGGRYLLFLIEGPSETAYWTQPFGRYEIVNGRLRPPSDDFAWLEIVAELNGLSEAEAIDRIIDAAE